MFDVGLLNRLHSSMMPDHDILNALAWILQRMKMWDENGDPLNKVYIDRPEGQLPCLTKKYLPS